MHFQKTDLDGTHYNWIEKTTRLFIGQPSRRSFDPFNGDQVLFVINAYGSSSERFTIDEGKSIEAKIQFDLPAEVKSEISVLKWIKEITLQKK